MGSDAEVVLESGASWAIFALLGVPVEVRRATDAGVAAVASVEGSGVRALLICTHKSDHVGVVRENSG